MSKLSIPQKCVDLYKVIPLHCRSESAAIPSPHHLSWLALNAYKELFTKENVSKQIMPTAHTPLLFILRLTSMIINNAH